MKQGQSVVCIDDSPGWMSGEKKLQKGRTYIVLMDRGKDIIVIDGDGGWDKSRFRLLDDEWVEEILQKATREIVDNVPQKE